RLRDGDLGAAVGEDPGQERTDGAATEDQGAADLAASELPDGVSGPGNGRGKGKMLVRHAVGRGDESACRHGDVFGERTIPLCDAEHLLAPAQVVVAGGAELAGAARTLGIDDDPLARRHSLDVLADGADDATG